MTDNGERFKSLCHMATELLEAAMIKGAFGAEGEIMRGFRFRESFGRVSAQDGAHEAYLMPVQLYPHDDAHTHFWYIVA